MDKRFMAWAVGAGIGLTACQTITEEMPNRPNPISPPIPVVVVPVPIPTPAPTPPPAAPAPAPNPAPAPAPGEPGGPDLPNNTNPVAKLTAKVYFIDCYGQILHINPVPLGCRIHMDATPTDQYNKHTRAKGTPKWTYSDLSLIKVGGNGPYNPVLDTKARGSLSMYCEVDGIRSNTVTVTIN